MLDLPAALNGDWQIINAENPETGQDCDKMQRFAVSHDGKSILLTEPWANFSATYNVILVEQNRMLTILEGEKRLTEEGDPVLWWFYFKDKDHFRFRQYDWAAETATTTQWARCTTQP